MSVDLEDLVDDASRALRALATVDLDQVTDPELSAAVLTCQRLRGRLEVAEARLLSRFDARQVWQPSGAKSAAAWLSGHQHLPIGLARQRVRHARALRQLPAVEEAWSIGDIDRSHVTTILGARTRRTRAAFLDGHKELLDAARTKGFVDFKRACDIWEQIADPDGAEQGAEDDRQARELHLNESFGGMWFGRITLDPINGTIVDTTLRLIERELFDADWAEAKARLGRQPLATELERTPAQRRADALVEMAIRARTAPVGGRRPAPLFTVVVGYETFAGRTIELWNRTVVTPGSLVRWMGDAEVERIVFDGPSRVVDVGRRRRFFRGAPRRAVEVRDRTCFHSLCDEPPDRTEIDHVHDFSKGGETTQENGAAGCRFHNRWKWNHPEAFASDTGAPTDLDRGPPHGPEG